jgi:hypothetical protein
VSPSRKKVNEFWEAWEAEIGSIVPGNQSTYPPPGVFKAWYREWKQSGIEAADWIHERV